MISGAPGDPGIYKMFDSQNAIIYIGKAKDLRKRLLSYTRADQSPKTHLMLSNVVNVECTITSSEAEALILEAKLIKKFRPKYNILLKDDVYFNYIKITDGNEVPQMLRFRGKNLVGGNFFGPFGSKFYLEKAIKDLSKIFKLRNCTDAYYKARKRPCLQYQIQRCSAPCAEKISLEDYRSSVQDLNLFLEGGGEILKERLKKDMLESSKKMLYEKAAEIRDKLEVLSCIKGDIKMLSSDIIVFVAEGEKACLWVAMYRAGYFVGQKNYFVSNSCQNILETFIGHFYQLRIPPKEIIVNQNLPDPELITNAIMGLHSVNTKIVCPKRGYKRERIKCLEDEVMIELRNKIISDNKHLDSLQEVQKLLKLSKLPNRIEVYDNSHLTGSNALGAMIVAGPEGFIKSEYRCFLIRSTTKGDDYKMMKEVLERRVKRMKLQNDQPDLIILDGGQSHLNIAKEIILPLESHNISVIAISKRPGRRKKGEEMVHSLNQETFQLDNFSKGAMYLQRLRDEAHDFAIKNHRYRRDKKIFKTQ
jgi:excinuclease ABC subunit C